MRDRIRLMTSRETVPPLLSLLTTLLPHALQSMSLMSQNHNYLYQTNIICCKSMLGDIKGLQMCDTNVPFSQHLDYLRIGMLNGGDGRNGVNSCFCFSKS
jgi:hypothetical protein